MVISYNVFSKLNQLDKDAAKKPLTVTNCGHTVFFNKKASVNHPDDNSDYLLLYLHTGTATLYANGQSFELDDGCVFLLNPDEQRCYTFHASEKNDHYYLYFKGFEAKNLLKTLNLHEKKVFKYKMDISFVETFEGIFQDFGVNGHENFLYRTVYLLELLTKISKYIEQSHNLEQKSPILPALEHMSNHYDDPLSLKKYAELCNLSVSRFSYLFQKKYHTSPIEYRNTLRYNKAKHLLSNYDLNISEIAYSLGFTSPLYFSHFFKTMSGLSPLAYRKKKQLSQKKSD